MPFDYEYQKRHCDSDGQNLVAVIEHIGHLLKNTGVFRVGEVIHGDSWNCLLAVQLLERQGFIELANGTGLTQDHVYRRAP